MLHDITHLRIDITMIQDNPDVTVIDALLVSWLYQCYINFYMKILGFLLIFSDVRCIFTPPSLQLGEHVARSNGPLVPLGTRPLRELGGATSSTASAERPGFWRIFSQAMQIMVMF